MTKINYEDCITAIEKFNKYVVSPNFNIIINPVCLLTIITW